MKNIFFLILLIITGNVFGQSWNTISGKNKFSDSVAFLKPKNNSTEDSVATLEYLTGKLKLKKVTNSFIIPPGVDSITLYLNQLCQWMGGTPTCYFLQQSTGGSSDSLHLNFDSTYILQYRNGTLIDSIFLIHTNLSTDRHLELVQFGGPYDKLLSATRLIDSVYASPFGTSFNYYRYADGIIDSLAAGGGSSQTLQQTFDVESGNAQLNKDDTITINGNQLFIGDRFGGNHNGIIIDDGSVNLRASYTNNGDYSSLQANSDVDGSSFYFQANRNGGQSSSLFGFSDITGSSLQLSSDSIRFNSTLSGASNGMVWTLANSDLGTGYWATGGGGTTDYETETASGATTFTFTAVPTSYDDFLIFVNGSKIRPLTDYTKAANVVTISTIVVGDVVEYQRIK